MGDRPLMGHWVFTSHLQKASETSATGKSVSRCVRPSDNRGGSGRVVTTSFSSNSEPVVSL